jgi:hypothetical protein
MLLISLAITIGLIALYGFRILFIIARIIFRHVVVRWLRGFEPENIWNPYKKATSKVVMYF